MKKEQVKCLCGSPVRANCGSSYHFIGGNGRVNMYSCSLSCMDKQKCGLKLQRGGWFDTYQDAKDDAFARLKKIQGVAKKICDKMV